MVRYILILFLCLWGVCVHAQIGGYVYSDSGKPLSGATITTVNGKHTAQSDVDGYFNFTKVVFPDSVSVSYVGYVTRVVGLTAADMDLRIVLYKTGQTIEVVDIVNTGFYQIPKERATGSFAVVDNELLNRSVGGNILQRLDGVASGVQFVTPNGAKASDIRVRGLATIQSDATPLIVLDNFPYEGDITSINPNDIENITVLKDAAAASIWGARAGNGVIVITTKQGRYNQKGQLSLNSNVTVGEKPDLLYSRNRLPSEIVMQIEKEKYEQGGYYLPNAQQVPFPEYVEMLMALKNGSLSQQEFDKREALMKQTEVREQAMKYLYQPSIYQQYALNARGGGDKHTYYVSGGYDRNRSDVIGNENNRINLNLQNAFKPFKALEFSSALWYSQQKAIGNGIELSNLKGHATHIGLSPYIRLVDEMGNPLSITKDYRQTYVDQAESIGLLDWQYRPLAERELTNRKNSTEELRANAGFKFSFLDFFNLNATYQYIKGNNSGTVEYDKDSYYVRNLVNKFTQADGSRIIPYAGIYQQIGISNLRSHSGRVQLNYNQEFGADHQTNGLMGGEVREFVQRNLPGNTLYNYNAELMTGITNFNYLQNYTVRPSGRSYIIAPSTSNSRSVDRYLSYFANLSHSYRQRYIVSGSVRWDGSNLFGVKTNQKGTPLWSVGGSWDVSKENWFPDIYMDYLRVRSTYGSAGNVNKNVSAYPTIYNWGAHYITQIPYSAITSVGNPSLRWEQVNTLNFGLDFRILNNRISGTIDYFNKNAQDLIGQDLLPPSTGIFTGGMVTNANLVNYADLNTKGLDVELSSKNLIGKFTWNSTFLISYVTNKITKYTTQDVTSIGYYASSPAPPTKGVSRDIVYAMPWNGLNPETGNLLIMVDGKTSEDYRNYYNSYRIEDLRKVGVSVPPIYGSLRNDFSWKGVSVSALVTFKSNYVFRRRSVDPSSVQDSYLNYHLDYMDRWQKPGDEAFTNVPARMPSYDLYRAQSYAFSDVLISKGDLIRLQDFNVSYGFAGRALRKTGIAHIRLTGYARNLGILWRSNKHGIDPEYPDAEYVPPMQIAIGAQIGF